MNKGLRILLILVAIGCIGAALYYPINRYFENESSDNTLEQLIALRDAGRAGTEPTEEFSGVIPEFSEGDADEGTDPISGDAAVASETQGSEQNGGNADVIDPENPAADDGDANPAAIAAPTSGAAVALPGNTQSPDGEVSDEVTAEVTPAPSPSPSPEPTVNRWERSGPLAYPEKDKVTLDVDRILPEYQEIYKMNPDLVGWLTIPGINLDMPVVQSEDSEYYLEHDFFGEKNANGQIILDTLCDPYTPSYNLVISGHNMRSGKMFGNLANYSSKSFWQSHKLLEFDTLMERKLYVVMAAFYSADYDVDEEGFRYNADIEYAIDLKTWLREVEENQLYNTEIDAEFGDEFLTLTTCNYSRRKDGRFVVICRKVRDGEEF